MQCPQCRADTFDEQGTCSQCGYSTTEGREVIREVSKTAPEQPEESAQPHKRGAEWRQELARRLKEIKHNREDSPEAGGDSTAVEPPNAPDHPPESQDEEVPALSSVDGSLQKDDALPPPIAPVSRTSVESPASGPSTASGDTPSRPLSGDQVTEAKEDPPVVPVLPGSSPRPLQFRSSSLLRDVEEEPAPEVQSRDLKAETEPVDAQAEQIEDFIDLKVKASTPMSAPEPPDVVFSNAFEEPLSDRTILLSRTLAGLIDLLTIIVMGSAFILLTDATAGIQVFSMFNFGILLISIFFVYSIFFLWTANQTIGMMLTDLRVLGDTEFRPGFWSIVVRCVFFLAGLLALGIGLFWALIDPSARCLHDRVSGTRIDRT